MINFFIQVNDVLLLVANEVCKNIEIQVKSC